MAARARVVPLRQQRNTLARTPRPVVMIGFRASARRLTTWPVRIKLKVLARHTALPDHPDLNAHGKLRQARLRYAGKKPPAPPPVSRADVANDQRHGAPGHSSRAALRRWQEATGVLLSRVVARELTRQFFEAGREIERQRREDRAAAVRQRNRSPAQPRCCTSETDGAGAFAGTTMA